MSELVEYGLHLPVGQEGRDIAFGRRQVSRDDPDVRLEFRIARSTGLQVVHPGPLPLVGTRMPVGIEEPQQSVVVFTTSDISSIT